MSKCWSDDVSFVFPFLCENKCYNTCFRGQMWGDFSALWERHAGMADSEGCEKNAFAEDIFKSKVAYLQHLSEIEKNRLDV